MTDAPADSVSTAPRDRIIMLLIVSLFVVLSGGFYYLALQKLERITQAAERAEGRIQRVMDAGAPLGHALVEKGQATIEKLPVDELTTSATQGVKEVGKAAKEKAMRWLKDQQAEPPAP